MLINSKTVHSEMIKMVYRVLVISPTRKLKLHVLCHMCEEISALLEYLDHFICPFCTCNC